MRPACVGGFGGCWASSLISTPRVGELPTRTWARGRGAWPAQVLVKGKTSGQGRPDDQGPLLCQEEITESGWGGVALLCATLLPATQLKT